MYRYVQTASRVHRVVLNGGQAFRVPLCNLSDRALLRMQDDEPPGIHCPHCWVGWEPPSETEAEEHAGCAPANPAPPPGARGVPMVEATRRLALGALAGVAVAGVLAGILFSPDLTAAESSAPGLEDLDGRVRELTVEVRALASSVAGHDHEPSELIVVLPSPTLGPPAPVPTPAPGPTTSPPEPPPAPPIVIRNEDPPAPPPLVVIVPSSPSPTRAPPGATPTPRASVDPTPCPRPGKPKGGKDPCAWPAN